MTTLSKYVGAVLRHVFREIEGAGFPEEQRRLLVETVRAFQGLAAERDFAQPLGLLYSVLRAWGKVPNEQAERVGAFLLLYLCSGDLFDDVQDQDLAGKPHETAGTPVAINSALSLMFLALKALRTAAELEQDPGRRLQFLAALNRYSLLGIGAQHSDLMGHRGAKTPEEVLRLHQGKTSSVVLMIECGALLAGCGEAARELYRAAGRSLTGIVQIVDDVRDVFGKLESPDLAGRKLTYPVACFNEAASEARRAKFDTLLAKLPGSLPEIREFLYEEKVIARCAETLEALRVEVHQRLAGLNNAHAAHRLMLDIVDSLCNSIYECEPLEVTAKLRHPKGGFHDAVRRETQLFFQRMQPYTDQGPPKLEPWHLPHYCYSPEAGTVYYPDLDDLKEEIVPFHSDILRASLGEAEAVLRGQLPLTVAHEMFHYLRHSEQRMTEDSWHEEYAANRLAVAYAHEHCPDQLERVEQLRAHLHPRTSSEWTPNATTVFERCSRFSSDRQGYEVDAKTTTLVQIEMVSKLAGEARHLKPEVARWLGAPPCNATAA